MSESQDAAAAAAALVLDRRLLNSGAIRALRGDAPAAARWLGAASRDAPAMPPGTRILVLTEGVRGSTEQRKCWLYGPRTAGEVLDAILLTEHAAYRDDAAKGAAACTPCRFCPPAQACTARPRVGFCGHLLIGGVWQGSLATSRFIFDTRWSASFCAASRLAAGGEAVDAPNSTFFNVERAMSRDRADAAA